MKTLSEFDAEKLDAAVRDKGLSAEQVLAPTGSGTELDAALRFARRFGDRLRYCPTFGWHAWNGRCWSPSAESEGRRLSMEAARLWTAEAASHDGEGREIRMKAAMRLESCSAIDHVLSLAKTLPPIATDPTVFDSDPWLLNVENGTLDLRAGTLRPHNRDDMITKVAPVRFDPAATDEWFDLFLNTLREGDPELPGFLQRAFGMSLTADVSSEKLFLVSSDGGSSKTTATESFAEMLGAYAVKMDFTSFCQSKHGRSPGGATADLVALRGARFAYATEGDENARLDAGRVKELTGGERIAVRPLYRAQTMLSPTWKLWLVSNFDPKADAEDTGVWRRMLKVAFPVVPEERRNPRVKEQLKTSPNARAAMLAWAVRGCVEWQRAGGGARGLSIPAAIVAETEAYKDKSDVLGEWWSVVTDEGRLYPGGWTKTKDLRDHYKYWCDDNGFMPLGGRRWTDYLKRRGLTPQTGSGGTRGWAGLRL